MSIPAYSKKEEIQEMSKFETVRLALQPGYSEVSKFLLDEQNSTTASVLDRIGNLRNVLYVAGAFTFYVAREALISSNRQFTYGALASLGLGIIGVVAKKLYDITSVFQQCFNQIVPKVNEDVKSYNDHLDFFANYGKLIIK